MYVDGELQSTTTPSIPTTFSLDSLSPMFSIGGGSRYNFYLDELALYGQELTASQIASNYNLGITSAEALMPEPLVRTNNLLAQALSDKAAYAFPLDATITNVQGAAMNGRTFSTTINTATYRAGRSATGGAGSWEIADTNTVGNEIQFLESTTPVITHEKGLSVEFAFYYPAYAVNDTGRRDIMIKNWSGGGWGITLEGNSGTNYINAGFSNPGYVQHSTALVPGRWYHVVAQWNPTDDYTYLTVNNVTQTSSNKNTGSGNNFAGSNYFNIGADSGLSFDFLAFYSSVYNSTFLSSTDITNHYNAFEAARYVQQSKTVVAEPMTAFGTMPTAVLVVATPATAFGTAVHPSAVVAVRNKTIAAAVLTASAQSENPVFTAGANKGAIHMSASALMGPDSFPFILGIGRGNPMVASGLMRDASVTTEKSALIKPQSLNASSLFVLPPAYYLVTDDRWYQRLLNVDYQSNDFNGVTTFFNTSTDIVRGGGYGGWNAIDQRNVFNTYYGYNLNDSPLPVAYAGSIDTQNRKALRLRNIALVSTDGYSNSGANWTFETYIKTTKKNQILFVGKQLGDRSNSQYQDHNAAWRLRDGKISLNETKSLRSGWPNSLDASEFTGFKDIADGEWHHIIIQFRQTGDDKNAPRTQVFIDGELDIQRYGYRAYAIHQIGYNSSDVNAYSDFTTSAVSLNQGSFVLERETHLNYYAAVGIIPVEAPTAYATATFTHGNKGRGNRGRALMLYFWPTFKVDEPRYVPYQRFMAGELGLGFTNNDQGGYGNDPDTFYPIATQLGKGANQFYDWDIWPVPVTYYPSGDTFVGDSHPILKDGIFKGGTDKGTVYVNPITDNERYLNLQEDLKDLSQFDMICFRNYPDESGERDAYGTSSKGVADPYFNVLDKNLFEDFLVSLRDAVDSGISLLVTNPQLAIDLGFIDTYHQVDALDGAGNNSGSDPYVPIKLNDPLKTGSPVLGISYITDITSPNRNNAYEDYYRNNYHQVVNTIPGLTDDPAYIWTDEVYYNADGLEYGELGRVWSHIEYNPGLQPGDKFLISSMINAYAYYAVPLESVKAGKVITKFADTYMHGTVERVNPYRNYATSIAVEPGTVVAGKQIGAKVFISFTDNVGNQKSLTPSYDNPGSNTPIENRLVELKSDYWIDYAYSTGSISDTERDYYKSLPNNIDNLYPSGGAVANAEKYWSLNGSNIVAQQDLFGDNAEIGTDTAESVKKGKTAARTRAGMKRRNTVSTSSLPSYTVQSSWVFPTIGVPIPSINTRALWWLSERLEYTDGLPQRPVGFEADAFMPQPQVTGYKVASINAQAMVSNGKINEVNVNFVSTQSPNVVNTTLPLTATAVMVGIGKNVIADKLEASARMVYSPASFTGFAVDEVVLYIMHEDPILYVREDVIK